MNVGWWRLSGCRYAPTFPVNVQTEAMGSDEGLQTNGADWQSLI